MLPWYSVYQISTSVWIIWNIHLPRMIASVWNLHQLDITWFYIIVEKLNSTAAMYKLMQSQDDEPVVWTLHM